MSENHLQNKGQGQWEIGIYNPEDKSFDVEGWLEIRGGLYTVTSEKPNYLEEDHENKTLFCAPAQNISYCFNKDQ
jgi:hypothetical protein